MADNYLENKMEEYHRNPPRTAHLTPTLHGAGTGPLPLAGVRVLIDFGGTVAAPLPGLVAAFVDAGCRVAFRCSDAAEGNRMAQANGARALPLERVRAVANLYRSWGGIDVLVADGIGETEAAGILSRSRTSHRRLLMLRDIDGMAAADVVRMCR